METINQTSFSFKDRMLASNLWNIYFPDLGHLESYIDYKMTASFGVIILDYDKLINKLQALKDVDFDNESISVEDVVTKEYRTEAVDFLLKLF